MEQLQAMVPPIRRAASAVALPLHINRLKRTVDLLLSPTDRQSDAWRSDVVAALRTFMDADRAILLIWRRSVPCSYGDGLPGKVIAEYLTDFAPLDHGMARREALGLSVWSHPPVGPRRPAPQRVLS